MIWSLILILIFFLIFLVILWIYRPLAPKKSYKIVKAGNISHTSALTIQLKDLHKNKFVFEGKLIDPSDYELFVVAGDSMLPNGIKDRDVVFIKRLFGGDKYKIDNLPVLIFEIDKGNSKACSENCNASVEFKLRKFISYININSDVNEWFPKLESNHPELSEKEVCIKEKYKQCVDKYKETNLNANLTLIFSSTIDTKENQLSYSFHPVEFLYGIVEFSIPENRLP